MAYLTFALSLFASAEMQMEHQFAADFLKIMRAQTETVTAVFTARPGHSCEIVFNSLMGFALKDGLRIQAVDARFSSLANDFVDSSGRRDTDLMNFIADPAPGYLLAYRPRSDTLEREFLAKISLMLTEGYFTSGWRKPGTGHLTVIFEASPRFPLIGRWTVGDVLSKSMVTGSRDGCSYRIIPLEVLRDKLFSCAKTLDPSRKSGWSTGGGATQP